MNSLIRFVCSLLAVAGLCQAVNAQLMRPDVAERWRAAMPLVDSRQLQDILYDPATLFYTDAEMPPLFQDGGGRVFHTEQNIAANPDPHGNCNREFPWLHTAGTDNVRGLHTLKFISLPRKSDGTRWPVVAFSRRIPSRISNETGTFQWLFPKGTIVGEILCETAHNGAFYPFEIRTRTKTADTWEVDTLKPFPTKAHLVAKLREMGQDKWADTVDTTKIFVARPMVDRQVARAVFREPNGTVDLLPKFGNDEFVVKLLTETTFKSSAGTQWDSDGARVCYAPASAEDFSIVPKGYAGGVVRIDNQSCTRCHETTARHAEEFAPNVGQSDFRAFRTTGPIPTHREWYGRERGSDGIFSFYPFNPRVVGGLGSGYTMRPELVQAGVIANFNTRQHPSSMYYYLDAYNPNLVQVRGPRVPVTRAN